MKIAIIGGGSLGLLFAHYLNEYHQVCVYVRSKEQKDLLLSQGLVFEKKGQKVIRPIKSALLTDWDGAEELTIVAVKQYHLQNVLKEITKKSTPYNGSYLFIQNGMGHLKWLQDLQANQIFVSSVEHGANKVNANHVIHTGEGITRIAIFKGHSFDIMEELKNAFTESFRFVFENNYEDMLEKKLIVNAVINPLTAVLNARNGALLENPHYYQIFKSMFTEVSTVLKLQNPSTALDHLENICQKTAANRSSMLQDLDGKRPTEVDAILGYVLERADQLGIYVPLTVHLYHAVKGKEYDGREEV